MDVFSMQRSSHCCSLINLTGWPSIRPSDQWRRGFISSQTWSSLQLNLSRVSSHVCIKLNQISIAELRDQVQFNLVMLYSVDWISLQIRTWLSWEKRSRTLSVCACFQPQLLAPQNIYLCAFICVLRTLNWKERGDPKIGIQGGLEQHIAWIGLFGYCSSWKIFQMLKRLFQLSLFKDCLCHLWIYCA